MIINSLDKINFRLKESHDFSWLTKYGTAFSVFDETGSGCIGIGMQNKDRKVFCKIAGVDTVFAEISPQESVTALKNAVKIYDDLRHPNLIKLIEHYSYKQFYVAVFEWASGECLFDHWNFEKYSENPLLKSPKERFFNLPIEKKLKTADVLFSFLQSTADKGYVAVDFYDGSIIYDFETDKTAICDIDLFLKRPVMNTMGEEWWGTKRLKAPEEYISGADIDEQTNIFTLGAMLFDFFGYFSDKDIENRRNENRFLPCSIDKFQLNASKYMTLLNAVEPDRSKRYKTISQFWHSWKNGF